MRPIQRPLSKVIVKECRAVRMITDVSRSARDGSRFGDDATQPLPRIQRIPHEVAHPFVVSRAASHSVPAESAQSAARTHVETVRLVIWLGIFALLNACDLLSTYAGLQSGMHEGNPLMSGLLGHYGFAALIGYKILVVCAVSIGVSMLRAFSKGIATATIWVCNALVCAVVVMNVLQFAVR